MKKLEVKKIVKIISVITLSIIVVGLVLYKINIYDKDIKNLINIDDLSEEFMDDYFEGVAKLNKNDNKDNILIVTSRKKIKDTYGATDVIEAPNNTYFLQYENEEDKKIAKSKLQENDRHFSVEENIVYNVEESDKEDNYNSWGIEKMFLNNAINASNLNLKNMKNVTVAIIDTGCNMELFNKYYDGKIKNTYNVLEESDSFSDMSDEYGHGTHIAGTIAEGTPDNIKILPVKVSKTGSMYNTDIITAINYVTYNKMADVINMSFGSYYQNSAIEEAINAANSKNIISVAAAGNDNTSQKHYPSALDCTISIASIDSKLAKSTFSNYGSTITFTAPGTDIKSIMYKDASISKKNGNLDGDDDHETISGTSMATPHAVASISILKSYNKNLTLNQIVELLKENAVDLGDTGWDQYYGYGLISFDNVEFCDNSDFCDELGVFKKENNDIGEVVKIEIPYVQLTGYNYLSINNLVKTPIKLYYNETEYITKKIGDLYTDGLEVVNYDPLNAEEQEIIIKYKGFNLNVTVPYPESYRLGWEYKVLNENSIELTSYKDSIWMDDFENLVLYVPETIDGYNVVSLADASETRPTHSKVFGNSYDYQTFKEIVLPKTLTKLGNYALSHNNHLESVTSLADSISLGKGTLSENSILKEFDTLITSLDDSAFEASKMIDNIHLSEDITEIPKKAFYGCSNLEHINIPVNTTIIKDYAFTDDFRLKSISLPEGLRKIGDYAFSYTDIENVTFPNSLEEIGDSAFRGSNIRNLFINKNITIIGEQAFSLCSSLDSIKIDDKNPTYDSRNDSNAIIETSTNELLKGIASTTIPNTVTKIGSSAFSQDYRIEKVEIPDSVVEIGPYAFYDCNYLVSIKIPRSVETIGVGALENYPVKRENDEQIPLTILTYTDAYAKIYAVDNKINYTTLDPSYVVVDLQKNSYKAFERVDSSEDISSIKLYYSYGKRNGSTYNEHFNTEETITDNYTINYINDNDGFRYGDEYYVLKGINQYGEKFQKQVNVTVSKVIPVYDVPENLTANIGQKLSEILLPNGFEWMNPTEELNENGYKIYKAKYVPSDIVNYEIIDNINVIVAVGDCTSQETLVPNISIDDKVYDGTKSVDLNSITVSNLNSNDYSIISATIDSTDIGNTKANVTLKLSDEKFKNYVFPGGKQQYTFSVSIKIVPQRITKPTKIEKIYTYNGEEQILELNNFDSSKMNIVGNKMTNAGKQDVIISLKNNNYIWDDETAENIVFSFEINKASLHVNDQCENVTVKYDGKYHSIEVSIAYNTDAVLKFMDEDGKYTLTIDKLPKYKNVGVYTVKYKIYLNDNYIEYFNEKTLIITANGITNSTLDYETIYDSKEHTIDIDIDVDDYDILYSTDGENYNIETIPKYKEVGEYKIYYKITKDGYEDLLGSNYVKIYGIKKIDDSIKVKGSILIIKNNDFSDLTNKINIYANSKAYSHFSNNINVGNMAKIKTNDTLKININNKKDFDYTLAYLGDVNGDGDIGIIDYIRIMKDIMGTTKLSGIYYEAADMNENNNIDIIDYIRIMKIIMEDK